MRDRESSRAASATAAQGERLQKVLARAGFASRREVEAWIRAGRISVNGTPAALGTRVSARDEVRLDGRKVHLRQLAPPARVFVCHRSPGEALRAPPTPAAAAAVTQRPPAQRQALLERLPGAAGRRLVAISPMPRIDGGLELVSSDGELALRLQRGVRFISSDFGVRIRGELPPPQLQRVLQGVLDSGERMEVLACESAGGEGANRWYTLSARGASGKEVRQLFERHGALVSRVLRTRFGPVQLARALSRGRYRELTQEELAELTAAAEAVAETSPADGSRAG